MSYSLVRVVGYLVSSLMMLKGGSFLLNSEVGACASAQGEEWLVYGMAALTLFAFVACVILFMEALRETGKLLFQKEPAEDEIHQ